MKPYGLISCFLFAVLCTVNLISQNVIEESVNEADTEFMIIITTNERGFQLECLEGCTWDKLSFNSYTIQDGEIFYKKAVVDNMGVGSYYMKPVENNDSIEEKDRVFAFIVQQTENGVFLESIKGTAWERFSYRCIEPDCRQAIDDMGMFMLDPTK